MDMGVIFELNFFWFPIPIFIFLESQSNKPQNFPQSYFAYFLFKSILKTKFFIWILTTFSIILPRTLALNNKSINYPTAHQTHPSLQLHTK